MSRVALEHVWTYIQMRISALSAGRFYDQRNGRLEAEA